MALSIEESWAEGARVLVVGCGGVGGCVAARLHRADRHIVGLTGNPEITKAIAANGLRATLLDGVHTAKLDVVTDSNGARARGAFDIALLAVPPDRLVGAARDVLPLLSPAGVLVPLTNGLPEERVAAEAGEERVVGAIVGFGASMLAPGVVEQTSEGGLTIGRLNGIVDAEVRRTATLLQPVTGGSIEETVTRNLRGARYSKLAINCAISSLGTIGGDRLGSLMRHRFVRRLSLEIMTEVTQVAVALGVKLERIASTVDLEWLALDADERLISGSPSLLAKHTVLLAVGARYRRLRSSMLSALERGRVPAVDFLNGEVVDRARTLSLPVPVNDAVVSIIHGLARGDNKPSLALLQHLYDETRAPLRALRLAA